MSQDPLEVLKEAMGRQFGGGSRITNCVAHSRLDFDKRPEGCRLCATDIQNHLSLAIRMNEFLNEQVDAYKNHLPALIEEVEALREMEKATRWAASLDAHSGCTCRMCNALSRLDALRAKAGKGEA